ncbi:MAG TPA: hypothetical protein VF701_09575, partial [Thermoanaerobaculia bacterium]
MKPLAISLGDPAGIGAEIVAKALDQAKVPAWLFGSRSWAGEVAGAERFIDIGGSGPLHHGRIDAEYGRIALASIDAAIE